MKKRRLLTILLPVVAALVISGVVFAFSATNLTGTGTIAVAADETYTLSSPILAFTPVSGYDETFSTEATITISNTGDTAINGFTINWLLADTAQVTWDSPALAVAPTGGYPIAAGATDVTLTFTLSGTLTSTVGSLDLSGAGTICDITPTG